MDAETAARRWAEVWNEAWPKRDVDAIVALYDDAASYRAFPFREPHEGTAGVRAYLEQTFAEESTIECRFGEPVVAGNRAAVEWWASWEEQGKAITLAGATLLRFAADGKIADHRDYWNEIESREPPYAVW